MECTYHYCNKRKKYIKHECLKKDEKVSQKYYYKYCATSNYDTCKIYEEEKDKNCLFTTILCEKMNLPKDNPILNNLHNLRKNILEKDDQYKELLTIHDRISPIISDAIRNTTSYSIDEFISFINSNFINPINKFITNNEIDDAIRYYKKFIELLVVNFSLGKEYANIRYYYKCPEYYTQNKKIRIRLFPKNI